MKKKVIKKDNEQLRTLIKEIITEQAWDKEESKTHPISFTKEDRQMLSMIYDIVVLGGARGGYGGGRLRAIPALGSIPD